MLSDEELEFVKEVKALCSVMGFVCRDETYDYRLDVELFSKEAHNAGEYFYSIYHPASHTKVYKYISNVTKNKKGTLTTPENYTNLNRILLQIKLTLIRYRKELNND